MMRQGMAVVREDGLRASRLRTLWRSAIAWSPTLLPLIIVATQMQAESADAGLGHSLGHTVKNTQALWPIALALLLVGAIWFVWNPTRSLQDRLAGTYLVLR